MYPTGIQYLPSDRPEPPGPLPRERGSLLRIDDAPGVGRQLAQLGPQIDLPPTVASNDGQEVVRRAFAVGTPNARVGVHDEFNAFCGIEFGLLDLLNLLGPSGQLLLREVEVDVDLGREVGHQTDPNCLRFRLIAAAPDFSRAFSAWAAFDVNRGAACHA